MQATQGFDLPVVERGVGGGGWGWGLDYSRSLHCQVPSFFTAESGNLASAEVGSRNRRAAERSAPRWPAPDPDSNLNASAPTVFPLFKFPVLYEPPSFGFPIISRDATSKSCPSSATSPSSPSLSPYLGPGPTPYPISQITSAQHSGTGEERLDQHRV